VIEAIQQRDPEALTELMRRNGRWVRGVIYGALGRHDEVEDVAQKVWLQVWREAERLEDPSRWRGWLYRIARNAATDAGRKRRHRQRLNEQIQRRPRPDSAEHAGPDRAAILQEDYRRMLDAVSTLPALDREPFVLRHLEHWSYQEIGDVLGLPVDTVETRLRRARQKLRNELSERL